MRIVMVTPDSRYIDRRILQEAETLITQGWEVILLANWEEGLPTHARLGQVKLERVCVTPPFFFIRERVILFVQKRAPWLAKLTRLALAISQKIRQLRLHEQAMLNRVLYYDPDVVHIHDLPYLRVGIETKNRLKIPLVYDAHELYPEIGTLTPAQKRELTQLEKRFMPQCDWVITVNPFIAAEMAQRYTVDQPEVILNAVTLPSDFAQTDHHNRFRPEFGIPADHQILLFQGWLGLERGLQPLVQALSQTPDFIHLVLMGYGEEVKTQLKGIAQENGISSRVHFKAAVPQAELLFWTASADAGIIPYPPTDLNHTYCSPNKLFEFIQAGLPIIANDLPFLRQIVAGEEFGVVMSLTDANNFAQAIRVMFDREQGGPGRFKKNLREKAAKYSWQVEAAKLLDLYAAL